MDFVRWYVRAALNDGRPAFGGVVFVFWEKLVFVGCGDRI